MTELKTVWHNGSPVLTRTDVLETLDLRDNQSISTDVFWEVVRLNSERGLAEIESVKNKTVQ